MAVQRRYTMGSGGFCICPKCGERLLHQRGIPCQEERCPSCGAKLLREGSYHHQLFLRKQEKKQKNPKLSNDESS
jgi:predicted amidophosphoribosyltransferase